MEPQGDWADALSQAWTVAFHFCATVSQFDIRNMVVTHGRWFYLITFLWTFVEGETFVIFAATFAVGRTGRAGAEGLAVSLVSHDEARLLRDIRRLLKQDIAIENVAGFEPSHPLRLDGSGGGQPKQNAAARKPNHARRPHAQAPNGQHTKPHAAANKQRRWRGERDARKA